MTRTKGSKNKSTPARELQDAVNRQDLDYVRTQNDKVLAVIDGMNGDENESEDESSYDDSDTDATFHPPSAQTLPDENTSIQRSIQAKASTSQKAKKVKSFQSFANSKWRRESF